MKEQNYVVFKPLTIRYFISFEIFHCFYFSSWSNIDN